MKFDDIFNKVLEYWPEDIDISDGKYFEEDNGFGSSNLSRTWNKVEIEVGETDEWKALMVWTIFTVLHDVAIESYLKDIYTIKIKEIDTKKFKNRFLEHLKVEGYENMLKEYVG